MNTYEALQRLEEIQADLVSELLREGMNLRGATQLVDSLNRQAMQNVKARKGMENNES